MDKRRKNDVIPLDKESPIQAVCGKPARTDLCGGREATRVPTANLGQSETPNHVSDDGSFRRKQPWRPCSQRSQRTLREQGEAGRPAPRWRPVSMRFRERPLVR
jgi:hypothetical protein